MTLYIDFFSTLPQKRTVKYHGGGNYARNLIEEIANLYPECKICILTPKWYDASIETEPVLFKYKNIEWCKVFEVNEHIDYEENSILWIPVLSALRDFKNLMKIKKKRHDMKLCATIHDLRMLDVIWDPDEMYYYSGKERIMFPFKVFLIDYVATKLIKKPMMKKSIGKLDQIYTVSNYALQDIIKLNKYAKVSWYYQSTIFDKHHVGNRLITDEYILFVSGGRALKNFSSALRGFVLFKKKNQKNKTKLVVTGIDTKTLDNLLSMLGEDVRYIINDIVSYEYVSYEELSSLYKYCNYTLYLSKKEGFGLPVIEAAMYGKTGIVSNRTSIPEVLGSAVKYVYPTNYNMIALEMEYFENKNMRAIYENRVENMMKIVQSRMVLEQQFMINDLLECGADKNGG